MGDKPRVRPKRGKKDVMREMPAGEVAGAEWRARLRREHAVEGAVGNRLGVELALDPSVDAVAGDDGAVAGAWTEGQAVEELRPLLGRGELSPALRASWYSPRGDRGARDRGQQRQNGAPENSGMSHTTDT